MTLSSWPDRLNKADEPRLVNIPTINELEIKVINKVLTIVASLQRNIDVNFGHQRRKMIAIFEVG